jgi:exosortase A-associated hydrolase 1/exosortase A-associated hydrolase 2
MLSTIKTGFLDGPNGKLHVSIFVPAQAVPLRGCVIHVPAFAEEMNKCRPMVSRQARGLAESGIAVVVPDLSGTGDSEGEFSSATWLNWKADLAYLVHWSQERLGGRVALWGVRLGGLLALDVIAQVGQSISALLLWQPVLSGKQHMAQFLRLRMAAGLMQGAGESVAQLREQLLAGAEIEVAGYSLSSRLFTQIEEVAAADLEIPSHIDIKALEVVAVPGKGLLPVTQKQVERWCECNIHSTAETVSGSPFWMTQEIALAPSLIKPGCAFLAAFTPVFKATDTPEQGAGELFAPGDASSASAKVRSIVFTCEGDELVGQLHQPAQPSNKGVLLVVGGPQYRVGSHRQFLQLARHLSEQGIPVFRFDYRGMGDSSGELSGFQGVNQDIQCAIDTFQRECSAVSDIVIWGLCDAATAAVFYAHRDPRVKALVLVNPWVYSTQGAAKAYLKHYYLRRFFSTAFWKKVLRGEFKPVESASSAAKMVESAMDNNSGGDSAASDVVDGAVPAEESDDLVARFSSGLGQFPGNILFVFSGNDLTAAEFKGAAESNRSLRRLMSAKRVHCETVQDADHTFARREWSAAVELLTAQMVREL